MLAALLIVYDTVGMHSHWKQLRRYHNRIALLPMQQAFDRLPQSILDRCGFLLFVQRARRDTWRSVNQELRRLESLASEREFSNKIRTALQQNITGTAPPEKCLKNFDCLISDREKQVWNARSVADAYGVETHHDAADGASHSTRTQPAHAKEAGLSQFGIAIQSTSPNAIAVPGNVDIRRRHRRHQPPNPRIS